MKVAITSTVLFDVPGGGDPKALERAFREANEFAIRSRLLWQTSSGVVYWMTGIERFALEVREQ